MSIVIRKVINKFEESAKVLRDSNIALANEFNNTKENVQNVPTVAAFISPDTLAKMKKKGIELFGAYEDNKCVGFVAIEKANKDVFYMMKLSVLPEYRHKGYGKDLINFVSNNVKENGGTIISIGVINKDKVLKEWFIRHGFVETGVKKFEHLPFELCLMEKALV